MKIRQTTNQGSTLLITLVTVGIIGLYMAAYLNLVSNQNLAITRSVHWNSAIPIAEAGIEEALTHLQFNPFDREANGWTVDERGYTKERHLGEGKYVVTISTNYSPDIVSKAYVRKPLSSDYLFAPRAVKVVLTNLAVFAKGMVAKGKITLSGNVQTDSFDSDDPNYSTNGQYDPAKRRDHGDIGSNGIIENSIESSGSVKVYGRISTGPGGAVGFSGDVSVGSQPWVNEGNTGIQPGWSSDDMNVQFPNVELPFTGGAMSPGPGTVGLTNYSYVLTTGDWELSNLSLSGQQKVVVAGDAILLVTGDVSMSGQSYIYISTNSSFKLYVGGSTSISGQGVANGTGKAINFNYYGLPSNQAVNFSGNSGFIGTIYAPNAEFKLSGGGSDSVDFVGASITGQVTMSGHYNFHFDESLLKGPTRGFAIVSWNEL
ncbi:MAG: hypothetical protein HYY23_12250 [Verrucomicrobia bacterium]|nr:hypothetical protein [Verrucomicrobiota bacterium]